MVEPLVGIRQSCISIASRADHSCIDDHSPTPHDLCWLFEAKGYRCLTTPDTTVALRLFEHGAVDLAVLDHILDQESGAELAGTLKKIKEVPFSCCQVARTCRRPQEIDVLLVRAQEPTLHLPQLSV